MASRQPLPADVLTRLTSARGELFYSNFARIVHSYWMEGGTYVTDDFGNSVLCDKEDRMAISFYCRQGA